MKKKIGLWIDHREAVIVALTDKGEQITHIKSDAEKQIRFAGGSRQDGLQTTEAVRGKKLERESLVNILMISRLIFVMQS